jgi:hypothetical protein
MVKKASPKTGHQQHCPYYMNTKDGKAASKLAKVAGGPAKKGK